MSEVVPPGIRNRLIPHVYKQEGSFNTPV